MLQCLLFFGKGVQSLLAVLHLSINDLLLTLDREKEKNNKIAKPLKANFPALQYTCKNKIDIICLRYVELALPFLSAPSLASVTVFYYFLIFRAEMQPFFANCQ